MSTELSREKRNNYWSNIAKEYHQHWSANKELELYVSLEAEMLQKLSGAAPGQHVLDLCCGGGRNTLAMAQTGAMMVGLDAAPGMLEQARTNAAECGASNVSFVHGDALELPFEDQTFNAVVGTRFMYMMSRHDKLRLLQEIHRVLKPQGKVVLQFNCGFWGLKHELINLFRGRKFRVRDRYLWPGQASGLFAAEGFKVKKVVGIKLPRLALLSKLIGQRSARSMNRVMTVPGFKFMTAYLLVQAQKI